MASDFGKGPTAVSGQYQGPFQGQPTAAPPDYATSYPAQTGFGYGTPAPQSFAPQYPGYMLQQPQQPQQQVIIVTDNPEYINADGDGAPKDETGAGTFAFSDESVRRGFIRKVFAIVAMQLFVTAGIVLLFTYVGALRELFRSSPWVVFGLMIGSMIVLFVLIIVLSCCTNFGRAFPANIILLFLITIAMSLMLGPLCSILDSHVVAWSMVATVCLVVAITLFTLQSNIEFTMISGLIFVSVFSMVFFIAWLVLFFVAPFSRGNMQWWHILVGCFAVILFSAYLVIDICLIVHRDGISPEDYIFAALEIYMDIILIFIYILQICAAINR